MDPHTPSDSREVPMFDLETVWREVSNADIWKIRSGESVQDYRERMLMVREKANRICYDLDLDLNRLHRLSESRKSVAPERKGESPVSGGTNVTTEPLRERVLPDSPQVETEAQAESDIEMWEPSREPPTYIEISSDDDERENWGSHYDLYGFEVGFDRGWSDEEDPEEDIEDVPLSSPSDSGSESDGSYSDSSSDSGEDGDDEDFDIASYDEGADTWDAWR